jgi:hypothetical protein
MRGRNGRQEIVAGRDNVRDETRGALLRELLGKVNAEWRALSRQSGTEAKLSRMSELRAQRLALMTEIFDLDLKIRRAG